MSRGREGQQPCGSPSSPAREPLRSVATIADTVATKEHFAAEIA